MPRGMSRGRAKGEPSLSEEVRHNPGVPSTARQWARALGSCGGWLELPCFCFGERFCYRRADVSCPIGHGKYRLCLRFRLVSWRV